MKKSQKAKPKRVLVTLILTESTASLLKLNVPHLDETHPANSRICIFTQKALMKSLELMPKAENDYGTYINLSNDCIKINSEVGLFSKSNCSSASELLDSDSESEISASNSSALFKKIDIAYCPMVSVRSKAHANNLNIDCNVLYATLLHSESQLSWEYICRICHGGDSTADLLTTCRCRGTIGLVHLQCLERWLKESNHSNCELCRHHYKIIREPKYSIPRSVLEFLRDPNSLKEIIFDLIGFTVFTPSAIALTYMFMLTCETLTRNTIASTTVGTFSSPVVVFLALFGMAAIDLSYSSWLILTLQKQVDAWRNWYNAHSRVQVILPRIKRKTRRSSQKED
ncbi:unnamed protein product [Ceutorhynchus assimilis]|uniref:RING-CH-type domain-containing protein n=1 Tax=Ceutorhynchus assimilis TaxID=467358 RepID=A0A9N9QAA6_9CUCU|nr:unnamed protein product [Ceutorhynchus assimilis]